MKEDKKVVIIGLDGMDWKVLTPLINNKIMPFLNALKNKSLYGTLESTIPPGSTPAWPSIVTGVNPGRHGIYSFIEKLGYNRKIVVPTYGTGLTLWNILNHNNKKLGLINLPMTYPPKKINGFMISCMMTPSKENYAYPKDLMDYLNKNHPDYVIEPTESEDQHKYLENITFSTKKRYEVSVDLMKKYDWDVFFTVFSETDRLMHRFWDSIPFLSEENSELANEVENYFRELDFYLKDIYNTSPDNALFMIISDHGFQKIEKYLETNIFLKEQGFLYIKRKWSNLPKILLSNLGITQSTIYKFLSMFKLKKLIDKFNKSTKYKVISTISYTMDDIDFEKTCAFSIGVTGWGPIFLNLVGREPRGVVSTDEYEKYISSIIKALESWHDPISGNSVVNSVYISKEIYEGPYVNKAPDLIYEPKEGYLAFIGTEFYMNKSIQKSDKMRASHDRYGIIIAHGPNIPNTEYNNVNVYDILPTILAFLDLPIPDSLDGNPITPIIQKEAIFEEMANMNNRPESVETKDEVTVILERLKNLGYLK